MLQRLASCLLTVFILTSLYGLTSSCPSDGPTEDLRTMLKGRCMEYSTFVNPSAVCGPPHNLNCTSVADTFIEAFAHQGPCDVNMSRFDAFLSATRYEMPSGQSLFWHGVYGFVHRYTQASRRRVTLEDTLTGYLINGLRFCSDPDQPDGIGGKNTAFCPSFGDRNCSWGAERSFWSTASKNFATSARGTITVMLNASTGEAFNPNSFFGMWELPNINPSVVEQADIWLVHKPGDAIRETCDSATVKDLRSRVEAKNIRFTCTVNPGDVLWMMCWDHQGDPECQHLLTSDGNAPIVG